MSEGNEKEEDESQGVLVVTDRGGYERIYTNKKNLGVNYLISFIVLMVLTEGYFILEFILRSNFYNSLNEFSIIYMTANTEMVSYLEVINVYREYYANTSTSFGREVSLQQVVSTYWEDLYEISKQYKEVTKILLLFYQNEPTTSSLLDSNSVNSIEYLYRGNLCTEGIYQNVVQNATQCSLLANGTTALGLYSLKTYVMNSLKLLIYSSKMSNVSYINDQTLWDISKLL